jgi:hypothetical protein
VSYIGAQPPKGQYRKLRNFEASFDGILTSFQLEVDPGGAAYYVIPGSANQLIVSLGGVIQEPNVDYTVSSSQITFTTAPAGGLNCFIIQCGDALNIGVPSDGTVSASKLNPAGGLEGQTFVLDSNLQFAFAYASGATNRIINGDMRIDQRNAGAALTVNSTTQKYPVDRFYCENSTSGVFTIQQSVVAPTGFNNSVVATVTTDSGSLTGTQYAAIAQQIEGFNAGDLDLGTANAKTFTLSFWVRSSVTGTYGGTFRNSADSRSYPFTYAISVANTWEQKSISVAGDTTGTWVTNNGIGLKVWFSFGAGPSWSGTAGAWAGSLLVSATGATNLLATNGATFYITGVQLETGTVATPFERRSYGQELALCQRYFQRWNYADALGTPGATALVANKYSTTDSLVATAFLDAPMRTSPTLSSTNASARAVLNSGAGVGVTIAAISAGVPNAGTNISGAITITCNNNSLAAGWGWLDVIGIISANAEL